MIMSAGGFGTAIPVLSLNNGFPGNISRVGERVIHARQVLPSTPNAILFGQGCVIVPDSTGGTIQSIADFIAGGGIFLASLFAGIAVRNVKTNLNFSTLGNVGNQTPYFGSFAPGTIGGLLERGSVDVSIANGQPVSQGQVYTRLALNGAIPAGTVGDFEAVPDGSIVGAAGSNTGNGTITGLAIGSNATAQVYTVTFTSGTAYKVTDANGNIIGTGTFVATATHTSKFNNGTVAFTLTEGSVVFITNDSFTVTVSALLTVALPGVVFTTGVIDGNGVAEITLKQRVAA
jgi:hypothetical protein